MVAPRPYSAIPAPQSNGLFGLSPNSQGFIGDALSALGQGLLAYGSGPQGQAQAGLLAMQSLNNNRQFRMDQEDQQARRAYYQQRANEYQTQVERQKQQDDQAQQQNQALQNWVATLPPDQQQAAAADPAGYYQAAIKNQFTTPKQQNLPEGMMYDAGGNVIQVPGYLDMKKQIAEASRSSSPQFPKYGMSPVWGVDGQGQPVLMQLGANGTVIQPQLPAGITPTPGVTMADTGTSLVPTSNKSGLPVAPAIAKDISGKASQEVTGKAQGEAQASLGQNMDAAQRAIGLIEDMKTDPARQSATGMSSLVMNRIPGTDAYGYQQKVNQLKGQVFLQAYNQLRGGGQITEVEGKKAEDAIARLNTAQREGDFVKALDDLEVVIKVGAARQQQKAGGAPQSPTANNDPLGIR